MVKMESSGIFLITVYVIPKKEHGIQYLTALLSLKEPHSTTSFTFSVKMKLSGMKWLLAKALWVTALQLEKLYNWRRKIIVRTRPGWLRFSPTQVSRLPTGQHQRPQTPADFLAAVSYLQSTPYLETPSASVWSSGHCRLEASWWKRRLSFSAFSEW